MGADPKGDMSHLRQNVGDVGLVGGRERDLSAGASAAVEALLAKVVEGSAYVDWR